MKKVTKAVVTDSKVRVCTRELLKAVAQAILTALGISGLSALLGCTTIVVPRDASTASTFTTSGLNPVALQVNK